MRDVSDRRHFERRLADRVAQMAALVDSVPYPVFVKDAQARFVTCNRAYEEAFPTTRERMDGRTVLDLEYIPEDARRAFHEEDVEVIRTGGHRRRELPILYKDGQAHTTLYSVDGFRLADGSPGGLIGLLVDISDRKLEQARLAEAEERGRLLLESTAEGIFGVDRGGRITFVNPAGAAMLGFAPEELVGRGAHEAVHSRRADGSPYPEAECRMARALVACGRPQAAEPFFARAMAPLVSTTSVPEYRRECLEAAVEYYAERGNAAESARLAAALRGSEP